MITPVLPNPPTEPRLPGASPPRVWFAVLALAAVVNLAAGVTLALQEVRTRDVLAVRGWTIAWLQSGENVYGGESSRVDYPPHAIVALAPLSLLSEGGALVMWGALNILLAIAAPLLTARLSGGARAPDVLMLALLFLCWSGTKTLLQFTLVVFVLGLISAVVAERHPRWSAACLAAATIKPQVAAPFLLLMALSRRWRVLAGTALFVALGVAVYSLWANVTPVRVISQYAGVLQAFYGGATPMAGASELRPLVAALVGGEAAGIVSGVLSVVMLAAVVGIGLRAKPSAQTISVSLALGACWALLTFRHLTYGFVVLLPAAAFLLFDDDPSTARVRRRTFWVLQAALIVDVPGAWRRLGLTFPRSAADYIFAHADRLLIFGLFVVLAVLYGKGARPERAVSERAQLDAVKTHDLAAPP